MYISIHTKLCQNFVAISILLGLLSCGCAGSVPLQEHSDTKNEDRSFIEVIPFNRAEQVNANIPVFTFSNEINEIVATNRQKQLTPSMKADTPPAFLQLPLSGENDQAVANSLMQYNCLEKGFAPEKVTMTQARADVEFLFEYLKYGYSCYDYLGGDAVFFPQKEKMLLEMEAIFADAEDGISVHALSDWIICPHLMPIIRDKHFRIDEYDFKQQADYRIYLNTELLFYAVENDYMIEFNGVRHRLIGADAPYGPVQFYPSLDKKGKPCWILGTTGERINHIIVDIKLENQISGEQLIESVALAPIKKDAIWETDQYLGYKKEVHGNIAVIQNRRLFAIGDALAEGPDEELEAFLAEAQSLQEYDALILDIRGNMGGDSRFAEDWVKNFTGMQKTENLPLTTYSASLATQTAQISAAWYNTIIKNMQPTPMLWGALSVTPHIRISNPGTPVIVLVDREVSSSGEILVWLMLQMDNVVVIGSNTAGCFTSGNVREIFLPHSRIGVSCGLSLFLMDSYTDIEGRGLEPDFWVPPEDSLEIALNFLSSIGF